jgi:hypothetical protein
MVGAAGRADIYDMVKGVERGVEIGRCACWRNAGPLGVWRTAPDAARCKPAVLRNQALRSH